MSSDSARHPSTSLPAGDPDLEFLFPPAYDESRFVDLCDEAFTVMAKLMPGRNLPRVPGWEGQDGYKKVLARWAQLPTGPASDPRALVAEMSADLLAGTTVWRCPELQYNIGTAVNIVAAAMYALALDLNVFLISDGQAGQAVLAEHAVAAILSELAGLPAGRGHGLFTFGGTGTIAYALKAGIRKSAPESVQRGLPDDVHVMITEDAHFSHQTVADWLGIGADRLITVPAGRPDRRTDLMAAERLLRDRLDRGARIAALLINGGTTYDHVIDDIAGFAALRDKLVDEYRLDYRPHLHVDSVIGWAWLMCTGTGGQSTGLHDQTLAQLREQHQRIRDVRLADSWGIDFHKGVGGCPVDCSFVMFNDKSDLARLRKGGPSGARLHQLAHEFSALSPVDVTLETSRAGGKALAALAALHSTGRRGYQLMLASLVDAARVLREELRDRPGVTILNEHAPGFSTMVQLTPPGSATCSAAELMHATGDRAAAAVRAGNAYTKNFFAWDNATRMNVNGGGTVYSFSSKYLAAASGSDVCALKFYPTSPHTGRQHMREAAQLLLARKAVFDQQIHDERR
jgi:L-2,4-diaminobutyrate decarboxylase